MGINSLTRWGFLVAALLLVFEVRATTIQIDIDTGPLGLNLAGQSWDLAFDLTNGNPQPNTVTISNFTITGDPAAGLTADASYPKLEGEASGNLRGNGIATLTADATPPDPFVLNEYLDNAKLGTVLTFFLEITGNKDPGLDPDAFAFFLLDSTGATFPTDDPTGAFFVFSIGNDVPFTPFCACVTVTPVAAAIPEPGALALAIAALLALCIARSRSRKIWPPKPSVA